MGGLLLTLSCLLLFPLLMFPSHGQWSSGTEGFNYQRCNHSQGMPSAWWQFHFPFPWFHIITGHLRPVQQWECFTSSCAHSKLAIIFSRLAGPLITLQGEERASECVEVTLQRRHLNLWGQDCNLSGGLESWAQNRQELLSKHTFRTYCRKTQIRLYG